MSVVVLLSNEGLVRPRRHALRSITGSTSTRQAGIVHGTRVFLSPSPSPSPFLRPTSTHSPPVIIIHDSKLTQ